MRKQFINAINSKLNEKYSFKIMVSVMCSSIHLENYHALEIYAVTETETSIVLETETLSFSIGNNYTDISYDVYEDAYIFEYENGVVITLAII